MNPVLKLQSRLRELLLGCPGLEAAEILIEDKKGLEFEIETKLATLSSPLITIACGAISPAQRAQGGCNCNATLTATLFFKPMFLGDTDAGAAESPSNTGEPPVPLLPTDFFCAVAANVHGAAVDASAPANTPTFALAGYRYGGEVGGAVTFSAEITAFLSLRRADAPGA